MPEALLPIFPLELVLLPGTSLPLHIFEDRYKEMIEEAMRDRTEFGVVQASEKGILNIGCTATVEEISNQYPDGRLDIITHGRRRFEINLLNQEKSYLRAAVSFFDDEDAESAPLDLKALAVAGFRALQSNEDDSSDPPGYDDPRLSFAVARLIPDLHFRQLMLAIRSETERLKRLAEYLPEYVVKVKRTAHAQAVAPKNGHGFLKIGEEA
ncbi:MAG: LON peptidase substrate-binding domain-containing protein [Bryobacteraceae bacterium]